LSNPIQEHIVQWHPTILSKLALVPQRMINSYKKGDEGSQYEKGDIAIRFEGCGKTAKDDCDGQAREIAQQWRDAFKAYKR
jgi:mannan polymerase II complex MNN11 subunit